MLTLIWVWSHTFNYHIRRLGVRFCYKKKGFYQEKLTIPALLVHLRYRCVTQRSNSQTKSRFSTCLIHLRAYQVPASISPLSSNQPFFCQLSRCYKVLDSAGLHKFQCCCHEACPC